VAWEARLVEQCHHGMEWDTLLMVIIREILRECCHPMASSDCRCSYV
jgi:hypothetical protein